MRALVGWLFLGASFGILLLAMTPARARDTGQWTQVSPEQREFYKGLKNDAGVECCHDSDGYDVVWGTRGDQIYVVVNGVEYIVPPGAVLKVPNKYGRSRVWFTPKFKNGKPDGIEIRCFIRGAEG